MCQEETGGSKCVCVCVCVCARALVVLWGTTSVSYPPVCVCVSGQFYLICLVLDSASSLQASVEASVDSEPVSKRHKSAADETTGKAVRIYSKLTLEQKLLDSETNTTQAAEASNQNSRNSFCVRSGFSFCNRNCEDRS